jgi:putative peptidoglycan lipid II flippase
LYLSSRIIEFPLGVFTLAIATVYFPKLAKMATSNSNADFLREYANGFIMTMCIAIPATFGIIATAPDIISLLFQWGLFNSADSDICVPVLIASSCGLPFFALSTFATRGFHSHKDTRTPVRISYWSFGANIILSIALMKPFGAVGLALANVLATMLFAVMLELRISKIRGRLNEWGEVVKIVVSGVLMAVIVWALRMWLADFIEGKTLSIVVCTGLIPTGVLIYIILLKVLKFRRLDNLKKMILRK